jgi:hypothetical protein
MENKEDKESHVNPENKRRLKTSLLPKKLPNKKKQLISQLPSVNLEGEVVLVKANNDGYSIFRLIYGLYLY